MVDATLKNTITKLARKSVREALQAEMITLRASLLPRISKREQKEIEKKHGKPTRATGRTIRVSL